MRGLELPGVDVNTVPGLALWIGMSPLRWSSGMRPERVQEGVSSFRIPACTGLCICPGY